MFDRAGSTLGIMDDLQVAIHSYDGCGRGCPGCLVDKTFKNKQRYQPILDLQSMDLINQRVKEYYAWAIETLNTKNSGYFGVNRYQIGHNSYTFRFGNHSELSTDDLIGMAAAVETNFRVFSVAPPTPEEIEKFASIRRVVGGDIFLEMIYDPFVDSGESVRAAIVGMREKGLNGYPELLITKRLVSQMDPVRFVAEHIAPFGDVSAQLQFGRYSPSRTRGFSQTQMVAVDEEVRWLTTVAREILAQNLDIHPIPLGEYAVTLLDEYGEHAAWGKNGVDINALPPASPFLPARVAENVRDIFLSSLYIDHNLDVFVWSESHGQHVLDDNMGYLPIGNLKTSNLIDMVTKPGNQIDKMVLETIRGLVTNEKCAPCRYKSFCATHATSLFRKWSPDDGEHCYGYLPVIREFQKNPRFLQDMVDGFKTLGF